MEILKLNIARTEERISSAGEIRFQIALLAALAATAAGFIARFVFDAPLVPELLTHMVFALSPIWIVEIAVGLLGPFAKHLGFLACVLVYVAALTVATAAFLKYFESKISGPGSRFWIAGYSFATWAITITGLIPLLGGGLLGKYLAQGAINTSVSLFIVHAVFAVALYLLSNAYLKRPQTENKPTAWLDRRRVVRGVGYTVLAVGIYDIASSLLGGWFKKGSGRVTDGDGVFPNINGLAREITPVSDFYEVSKNPFDPHVDAVRWRLEVSGLVNEPFSLGFDEIKAMPSVEQYSTLACISNEVGGDLIGNAVWRGVRLKDVLEKAGLKDGVVDIVLRASDDYRDSIPLDRALAAETLLVYEMNGEPLTPTHGHPLRLIVPGIYGMKNVKWVKRIEAVGVDVKGYWQARGWDDRAEYKTMSRIDLPDSDVSGESVIAGIAFAGDRSVSKVEVSTDGGKTWEQAEIKTPLSNNSWTLWQAKWRPSRPGKHTLVVRATDGRGITQTAEHAPPAPSGSTGYHRKTVTNA
jgi:DMSO/TMAO reductase YedYZ molybdopterin-dependent catalytic subunit